MIRVVALAMVLGACSSGSPSNDTGSAGGGPGGSAGGGGIGGSAGDEGADGGCNALTLIDDPVTYTASVSSLPMARGGSIKDGTYVLTSYAVYSVSASDVVSASTIDMATTVRLTGNQMEQAQREQSSAISRTNYTVSPSGSNLIFTLTCPANLAPSPVPYTATANTLQLFFPTQTVQTYARR